MSLTFAFVRPSSGQIVIRADSLSEVMLDKLDTHRYRKAMKGKAEVSFISSKPVDGACVFEMVYRYKRRSTTFRFVDGRLLEVRIDGKNSPFITSDSVRAGDRIPLSKICRNLQALKSNFSEKSEKKIRVIVNNSAHYSFRPVELQRATNNTMVRIRMIRIYASKREETN